MKTSFLRIISLVLVVLLAFSSVAILSSCDCGGGGNNETTTNEGDGTTTTVKPGIFDEPIEVDSIATALLAALQNGSIEVSFKETEETTPIFNAPAEIIAKLFSNVNDGKLALQVKPTVNGETLFDGGIYFANGEELIAVLTPFLENAYGVKFDNFFGNLSTSKLAETIDKLIVGSFEGDETMAPVKELSALVAGLEDDLAALGTILEKYVDVIGTELDKIPAETKEEQITVDGKTVNTTVTTYTIDNATIITLINNLINEVKNDAELKALIAPYYDAIVKYFAMAIRSEDTGNSPDVDVQEAPDSNEAIAEEEEDAIPTLDELFDMIPTLTEDAIKGIISFDVSVWESNETKAIVKFALNGKLQFKASQQNWNENKKDFDVVTYDAGAVIDFTAVIGEESMSANFVCTPINSLYTAEEIVEETIVISFGATYGEDNLSYTLTAGTPKEAYFSLTGQTEFTETTLNEKIDVVINKIYDDASEKYCSILVSGEANTTVDEATGAFDSSINMSASMKFDGEEAKEMLTANCTFKNVVETSTDELEKGKMTLNASAKFVGDEESDEEYAISFEMPYELHADGNFKIEVNTNLFGTEYYGMIANEVVAENKGVISVALSMDTFTMEEDETAPIMAHSGKLAYETKADGSFAFDFTYFDNANFTEGENTVKMSFALTVVENTEKVEKGEITASIEMRGGKYEAGIVYDHNKDTGAFIIGLDVVETAEGESVSLFKGSLQGSFLLDKNGFVLKLGKLDITSGEETMNFVIDLTVTVKADDTMPEFPEYTNIFDIDENALNGIIEDITALFPSGDEYVPTDERF